MTAEAKPGADMVAACRKLRLALTLVELAVMDLHEVFLKRNPDQLRAVEQAAVRAIEKAQA